MTDDQLRRRQRLVSAGALGLGLLAMLVVFAGSQRGSKPQQHWPSVTTALQKSRAQQARSRSHPPAPKARRHRHRAPKRLAAPEPATTGLHAQRATQAPAPTAQPAAPPHAAASPPPPPAPSLDPRFYGR